MWREYFGSAGTILAVVNGVLAIVIATLPTRRSVYKLRLGALALLIGALAVGAAFYNKYRVYVQTERAQSDRTETGQRLEAFIAQGRSLIGQIKDASVELPSSAADVWAQQTEIYLRDRFGEPAVTRFRKPAGELYGVDETVAAPRVAYWRAVRDRVVNLQAIAAESSDRRP
jgi:hypothetical protein